MAAMNLTAEFLSAWGTVVTQTVLFPLSRGVLATTQGSSKSHGVGHADAVGTHNTHYSHGTVFDGFLSMEVPVVPLGTSPDTLLRHARRVDVPAHNLNTKAIQ